MGRSKPNQRGEASEPVVDTAAPLPTDPAEQQLEPSSSRSKRAKSVARKRVGPPPTETLADRNPDAYLPLCRTNPNAALKYPWTRANPLNLTAAQQEIFDVIKDTPVLPTGTPHKQTLLNFMLDGILEDAFTRSGLGILFSRPDSRTFSQLLREFLCTFVAEKDGVRTIAWKFQLGGKPYRWPRSVIAVELKFPFDGGMIPSYTDEERKEFWHEISTIDDYFIPDFAAMAIKEPFWKCAHRLLATSVNARKEHGDIRLVDFDMMLAMRNDEAIDFIEILGDRFLKWQRGDSILGGGLFVTVIAHCEGWLKSGVPTAGGEVWSLDRVTLVNCHMFDLTSYTWKHNTAMSTTLQRRLERKKATAARRSMPAAQDQAVPSPTRPPRTEHLMQQILANQEKMFAEQQKLVENQERMYAEQRGIAANQEAMRVDFDQLRFTLNAHLFRQGTSSSSAAPMETSDDPHP